MKQVWCIRLFVLFGAGSLHAGPADDAIVAMMRLSEATSYGWRSTVSDDARTYEIEAATSRAGFSRVKMPVINSVRRKLGRDVSDTRIEVIFRGNVDCVLRTDEGWMRPDELPAADESSVVEPIAAQPDSNSVNQSLQTTVIKGTVVRPPPVVARPPPQENRGYSNLQLAISPPHEELGVMVGSHRELRVEGDMVTGTLTDLGAQLLLVRDGQTEITPLRATGTFKIWLRNGSVARYQVSLEGTLAVRSAKTDRITVNVQQRATTELFEVGTARVEVPEPARFKLAGP